MTLILACNFSSSRSWKLMTQSKPTCLDNSDTATQMKIPDCEIMLESGTIHVAACVGKIPHNPVYARVLHVLSIPTFLLSSQRSREVQILHCIHIGQVEEDQFVRLSGNLENKKMMTSSNGNIFRVTGHLCGEFTGPRWIPRKKTSDAELWCFLWYVSE